MEDVLFTHPAVMNVSVVGLPDHEWGEIVAAFVRPRPGSDITSREFETYCRTRIASYKVPRVWTFVDEFPETSSGKIQKFVLRDRFLRDRAGSAGHQERGAR